MKVIYFSCFLFLNLCFLSSCSKGDKSYVMDVDGNKYEIVQIGTQIWMAENLKTTRYNDKSSIINITDNLAWSELSTGAFSYYDNLADNDELYGKLYNWYTVSTGKLCPKGWRIPDEDDWNALINFLGGEEPGTGGKLKSLTGWSEPNTGATNSSGFSAIGGGLRSKTGGFFDKEVYGVWWSSTEDNINRAYYRAVLSMEDGVETGSSADKKSGYSCRCLKN